MCEQHLTPEESRQRPGGPAAFVDELVVAITNARIYSEGHPRVEGALQELEDGLTLLRHESRGRPFALGIADGVLFFERRPLLGATLSSRRLLDVLGSLGSGGLRFGETAGAGDLRILVDLMRDGGKGHEDFVQANQALEARGCTEIAFLPPYRDAAGMWSDDRDRQTIGVDSGEDVLERQVDLDLSKQLYQDVVFVLQDAMVKACKGDDLHTDEAEHFVEAILTQLAHDTSSMMRLSRYERYDAFTFGHSIRVCFIAMNFARHLTDDPVLLQRIGLAALMHDIGKAWVPFEVLHFAGRLSPEARREMNRHTEHGAHILLGGPRPDPLAVAVAFTHHHLHAGGGYPEGIRNARQSMATMIVKLSDVYEALTAVRPYKPRMSPVRAYRIMMSMEGHFEPALLRRFMEVNGVFPVGSRVRLEDGEVARVEAQSGDLLRPVVRTERAAGGEELFPEDVRRMDLSEDGGQRHPRVERILLEAEM